MEGGGSQHRGRVVVKKARRGKKERARSEGSSAQQERRGEEAAPRILGRPSRNMSREGGGAWTRKEHATEMRRAKGSMAETAEWTTVYTTSIRGDRKKSFIQEGSDRGVCPRLHRKRLRIEYRTIALTIDKRTKPRNGTERRQAGDVVNFIEETESQVSRNNPREDREGRGWEWRFKSHSRCTKRETGGRLGAE